MSQVCANAFSSRSISRVTRQDEHIYIYIVSISLSRKIRPIIFLPSRILSELPRIRGSRRFASKNEDNFPPISSFQLSQSSLKQYFYPFQLQKRTISLSREKNLYLYSSSIKYGLSDIIRYGDKMFSLQKKKRNEERKYPSFKHIHNSPILPSFVPTRNIAFFEAYILSPHLPLPPPPQDFIIFKEECAIFTRKHERDFSGFLAGPSRESHYATLRSSIGRGYARCVMLSG